MVARPAEEYFTLDGVAAGDRQERWEQLLSQTHVEMSVRLAPDGPGHPFRATVRRQWIDDLALVDAECEPCSGSRSRAQVASTAADVVAVLITRSGRETVMQGGAQQEMRPGDALVWESHRAARFVVLEPLVKRSLLIPRAALAEVGGQRCTQGGLVLDGAAPATRLLADYLDVLSPALPRLAPPAVSAARNATLELVMGAVRPDPPAVDAVAVSTALRTAIEGWIDRHLEAGELTPATIAAAHGVSVRTVYRVFEASGETVSAVVRVRRLARTRRELAVAATPISAIARRWGFSDASHFARMFKAHYGCSPSEYRAGARSHVLEAAAP